MIKILKEGKKPIKTKTIFREECYQCGCEFEFEIEDCEYTDNNIDKRFYSIKCPTCNHSIWGNNIYNLEHREEVVE